MELSIHVIFALSRTFPDMPGVFAYEMFETLPNGAPSPPVSDVIDVDRDGTGSDMRRSLLAGLSRLLRDQTFQRGTIIRVFSREQFLIKGLNGDMFDWRTNNWRNFHDAERIAYVPHWEIFIELVELSGVKFECRHLSADDAALARIRVIAENRRDFLKSQR